MPLTPTSKQLLHRLYFDRAYTEAARAVGYGGCTLAEFWERVKPLGIPQGDMLNAVYDITRGDKREQSRYELRDDVRDACWMLLGPPPEKDNAFWRHPDGTPMERPKPEVEVTEAQPAAESEKKKRR